MDKILLLIKIMLKRGFRNNKLTRKKKIGYTFLFVFLLLSLLPLIILYIDFLSDAVNVLKPMGQEGIILSMGLVIDCMVILFFGIFYIISTFYFSKDTKTLMALPLKPYEILISKLSVVLIYEYLTESFVLLPIIVVYGIETAAGLSYYLFSLIIFLTLPLLPLIIASIIVMIIMRFTSLAKNKDRYAVFAGILGLGLGLGFNVFLQNTLNEELDQQAIQDLIIEANNSISMYMSKLFPGVNFAAKSLMESFTIEGFLSLLVFLAIITVGVFIFIIIGNKLYFQGAITVGESAAKRVKMGQKEYARSTVKKDSLYSYIMTELRVLFRTPVYLLNCVLINFIWPVIILIVVFSNDSSFAQIRVMANDAITKGDFNHIIYAVFSGVIMFLASSNAISATSISREGSDLYIKKYIPVPYITQIKAKILTGVIVTLMAIVLFLIVGVILFDISIQMILILFILSVNSVFLVSNAGIIFDLYRPKLGWDNEQYAVKQNLNVLFSMVLGILMAAISIAPVIILEMGQYITVIYIIALSTVLNMIIYKFHITKGVKLFSEINKF